MTADSPTRDDANKAGTDAWIISEIIIALCDSDISGTRTQQGGDLCCQVRWLAERQQGALEVVEQAIGRLPA